MRERGRGGARGASNNRGSTATAGRRLSTTNARGSTTTPRRGNNATNARDGRSPAATNEQVTPVSLSAVMSEMQAARVTITDELRAEVAAAEEGVAAAEKGAVDVCLPPGSNDDYRRGAGEDYDESAVPVRRVEETLYYGVKRNLSVRGIWTTRGEKRAVYGLKQGEMQAPDIALWHRTRRSFNCAPSLASAWRRTWPRVTFPDWPRTRFSRSRWRWWMPS